MRELYNGCCYGRHAEMDVIKRLLRSNKIKVRKLTMIVIRINKNGELCNSHPCIKCISYMMNMSTQRKHVIKNIYYSNNDGNIEHTTLTRLITKDDQHKSKRFRNI